MSKVNLVTNTPNAEETIVEIARVSSKRTDKKAKPEGLINYLIKHKHWSPFEHASMTLEIDTSKAIGIQLIRHRSFTFQEFSQRYADTNLLTEYIPVPELRRQDTKNRQNSTDDLEGYLKLKLQAEIQEHFHASNVLYKRLLEHGVAKECARFVLPLATPTRIYMSGSCRSWIHYIQLRSANGTQKEHMDIALACKKVFTEQFPSVSEALEWI